MCGSVPRPTGVGGNREVVPCSSRFRKIPLIGETFLLFFTLARLAFFLKIRLHYSDYTELNTQNSRHFSSAFDPALEKVPAGRHSLCVTNRFFVSHVVFVVVGGFFSHSEAPNYHPNQQTDRPWFNLTPPEPKSVCQSVALDISKCVHCRECNRHQQQLCL